MSMWPYIIAAIVLLMVLKRVIEHAAKSVHAGFADIEEEARMLGLEGENLEVSMRGRYEGFEVTLEMGGHRLRRPATSGSVHAKMLVVTLRAEGIGAWWLASSNLASRSVEDLPTWGEGSIEAGDGWRACCDQSTSQRPWSQPALLEQCRDAGLELGLARDAALEAKFSPLGPMDDGLGGRAKAVLDCAVALARASSAP